MRDPLALHVTPSPDVVVRPAGAKSVLLGSCRETYDALNPTAARIWQSPAGHHRGHTAVAALYAEYGADGDALGADVARLLSTWLEPGCLVEADRDADESDAQSR